MTHDIALPQFIRAFEVRLEQMREKAEEDEAIRRRLEQRGSIISFIIDWHSAHPDMRGKSADEQWAAYQTWERENWKVRP